MLHELLIHLADSTDTNPNGAALTSPITYLTGLGIPATIIGLFLTGKLRTEGEVTTLNRRLDEKDTIIEKKDEAYEKLLDILLNKVMPALSSGVRVVETMPNTEAATLRELQSVHEQLRELARQVGDRG